MSFDPRVADAGKGDGEDIERGVGAWYIGSQVRFSSDLHLFAVYCVSRILISLCRASSVAQLALVVTELEAVIIEGKPPIKATAKKDQEYDRAVYFSYVSNPQSALQKLYQFSYALAKPECVLLL